jgi:phage-related minor tail protein
VCSSDLLKSIAHSINQVLAQLAVTGIIKGIGGSLLGGILGGGGNGDLMPLGEGGIPTSPGGTWSGSAGPVGAQHGGVFGSERNIRIAEGNHAEAVIPLRSGAVPVSFRCARGGGGHATYEIHNHWSVYAPDGDSVKSMLFRNRDAIEAMHQQSIENSPAIRGALRRVGR